MSNDAFSRRDVLKLGAGLGALALLPGCGAEPEPYDEGTCDPAPDDGATPLESDPAAAEENALLFTHGVQAGSATADGAILWSFCDDAAAKKLKVWREAGGKQLLAKELDLTPADGYLRAEPTGLAENTVYRYAFFDPATGKRSAVGRFRTAFGEGCGRALTIGATACTNLRWGPFHSLEALAKEEFDLLVHLGDYSYNDGAETLAAYRTKWRNTIGDVGYRAVLPRASLIATWDDHEFRDNSGLYGPNASAEKLALGKEAFFENVPMRPAAPGRLWQSFRWGKTAEFFVLDCRTERDYATRESDKPIYVSTAQLEWLKGALEKSTAHFKVILNSVPILGFPESGWNLALNDRWQGFAKQREELLGFITGKGIRNVWFLSGDLHVGVVARIDPEGPASAYWEILVGPGANYNPLWVAYQNGSESDREAIAPAGQFAYFSGEFAGTTLTFDPAKDSVRVRFVDVHGKVAHDREYRQEAAAPAE